MHAIAAAAGPRVGEFGDDVRAELVRYLYRQAPGSMVANLVVAAVLVYVLWDSAEHTALVAWMLGLATVCALRLAQVGAFFRRSPPKQRAGRWAVASAAGSAFIGATWALASLLFLDPGQPISLITITVIVMGICAGSVVNLASYLPSFWIVVGPSMGALIGVLLWHGGAANNTVALLAGVASLAYFVGARNVHRLLTESLQLSFENVALRRSAEQANAAKTRFLAAASHDLRQPIHALGLLFATLADRVRDEASAPLLEQIDQAVEAVDSMLNSLLDVSKLDAGVVRPSIGPVDLAALLQRLNDEYQPIARLTGNRLQIRPATGFALSDAGMLHRIMSNLISNALRYTVRGRVLVAARPRGGCIRIEVYDTGPGIPPASREDIFLEFHQLGNPERDRRRGLGLGLAIVKRLAELLAHPLELRSALGRGSLFSIVVPKCSGGEPAAQALTAVRAPGARLEGRRVLVLDDEVSVLDAMRTLLERWGCEVVATTSPDEAEAQLSAAGRPDLLIVDYRLRRHASGIEAIGRLRRLAGAAIPALIVTGDTAPDRLREAQESGYPLLHKPVTAERLRAAMVELMSEGS